MRFRRFRPEPFGVIRKRMIAETELALLYGIRFPERITRIPTMEVGTGRFHPEFAARFWAQTLDIDMGELIALEDVRGIDRIVL